MNIELIQTFLNVVEYQNISTAAQRMFTTQGTVSKRIQQLELELGVPLLTRQKGLRTIELTTYGNNFIPIAQQWNALYKDSQNLKNGANRIRLTIGASYLINVFTLSSFYQSYALSHPEICLFTDTLHSSELYPLLDRHRIDIGYAFISRNYPHIIQTPLYREPMYLVCHKDSPYENSLSPSQLDAGKEIYVRWDRDFETWHEQRWPGSQYLIRVTAGSVNTDFFSIPGLWSILPYTMAHSMAQRFPLSILTMSDPPPRRICYQLEHRYPSPSLQKTQDHWKQEVNSYLQANSHLLGLEPL